MHVIQCCTLSFQQAYIISLPSLPWKGMRGCRNKLQGSVLMAMLLLLWLCDVGTAAVTAARACPAAICVVRSSYLTSLKGVPQSCEMGRDMSSSSSSIRRLSGKLPGEERGDTGWKTLEWVDKNVCFGGVSIKCFFMGLCLTHAHVFMMSSWQVIWAWFVSRVNKKCQISSCYQWKLCPLAYYLTRPALNVNKSLVIIIPSERLMLCHVTLKTNKQRSASVNDLSEER